MAKKADIEEKEIKITPVNEVEINEEVEVAPAIEVKVSKDTKKLVEIHTLEDVDATIGGAKYKFRKGTDQKVPVDVAAILTNSRKAYRK